MLVKLNSNIFILSSQPILLQKHYQSFIVTTNKHNNNNSYILKNTDLHSANCFLHNKDLTGPLLHMPIQLSNSYTTPSVVRNVFVRNFGVVTRRICPVLHVLHPSVRQKDVVASLRRLPFPLLLVAVVVSAVVVPDPVAEGVFRGVPQLKNRITLKKRTGENGRRSRFHFFIC